ncbi:MAG: hypothetical protein COA52_09690 [Hyphomicrobiales bacterium]|nr:MAG: hypothetical protein COA52_09690 [Hyphomicrobiales bacterium]
MADLDGPMETEMAIEVIPLSQRDAPGMLTRDEFYDRVENMLSIPNAFPVKPFPIKALPIAAEEEISARKACNAIYNIAAEEHSVIGFMIEPGSKWFDNLLPIAAFFGFKLRMVAMELKSRIDEDRKANKAKEINPQKKPAKTESEASERPTPDNQPIDIPDFLAQGA